MVIHQTTFLAFVVGVVTTDPGFPILQENKECGHRFVEQSFKSNSGIIKPRSAARQTLKGQEAIHGAFPWQVDLQVAMNASSMHWCGGTILSENFILTAAHCIQIPMQNEKLNAQFLVVAGAQHWNQSLSQNDSGVQIVKPKRFEIHPKFISGSAPVYDIGLVELAEPIKFNKYIQPACLPKSKEDSPKGGESMLISGWGTTSTSLFADKLQGAQVKVMTIDACKKAWEQREQLVTDDQVCTFTKNGSSTCVGDSGGPLVGLENGRYVVQGIISWGTDDCGLAVVVTTPDVYVRVAAFLDWITAIMNPSQ